MALTYAQLTAALQDYTQAGGESAFDDNIPNFVQSAEETILKSVQLPVFRDNVTGTFTSGNRYLGMPDDFLAVYSMAVTSDTTVSYLLPKEVSFIREAYPSTTAGLPRFYALFDSDSFIVGPIPDENYTVELHYMYRPTSIVTAGSSWLGDNAETALLYGALAEAYTFLKGEPDLLKEYQGKFAEALANLKKLGEGLDRIDQYRNTVPRLAAP